MTGSRRRSAKDPSSKRRARTKQFECAICHKIRPVSAKSERECTFCGIRFCAACEKSVRECAYCGDYACSACAQKEFTVKCPSCGLGHHDNCELRYRCSWCNAFFCDDCGKCDELGDVKAWQDSFTLCESCDAGRSVCHQCLPETIGDETLAPGACPTCDIFNAAMELLYRWNASKRFSKNTLWACEVMWREDIRDAHDLAGYEDIWENNERLRDLAKRCLLAAAETPRLRQEVAETCEGLLPAIADEIRQRLKDVNDQQ